MPRAMTDADIDPIAEQVDREMMETGEQVGIASHKFDVDTIPVGQSGRVIFDKAKREPGRPTVRNMWTWDGRPSTIPLAYEPSGKRHDGGRKYILKRHCATCNYTGFYGPVCPMCQKEGREQAPPVAAYYFKKEQVPMLQQFFGTVDCFVPVCIRRGKYGFMDEPQMRQHAMGKHRLEYRAFQDSQQARNDRELTDLRSQVAALMAAQLQGQQVKQRMAKARAARVSKEPAVA